jgi:putative sigma-54 modulation protein
MDLSIRGNGVTITDDLRTYAGERAARLDRLVTGVDSANLDLRHNHSKTGPDTVTAQVTVKSGPTVIRAEERDADIKAAIDRAIAKIELQVRKVHSKRARRKGSAVETIRGSDVLVAPEVAFAGLDPVDDVEVGNVVRTKQFPVKPMGVDEAIEQLELLGHDFYLFHDADTGVMSVIYRRRDGDYGMISPEKA